MTHRILYWDSAAREQRERDSTPEEDAQRAAELAAVTPAVPQEVTRRQGVQALFRMHGITEAMIEAKIVELVPDPDAQYLALADFRASTAFQRGWPLVNQMGAALGLALDPLFIFAATL